MPGQFWAEAFRDQLRTIGNTQLDSLVLHRIDLSGVIQSTMLEAFTSPHAPSLEEDRFVWLRRIFINNLLDELRRLRSQKRNIRREVSLDRSLQLSSVRMERLLIRDQPSPSEPALHAEARGQMMRAIAQLPEAQRLAIELHHLQGLPLEQIASQLGRPKTAIAALIYRGMTKLRAALDESSQGSSAPSPKKRRN